MSENSAQINPVCQQMLNCRLTGNITPISWFRNILTNSDKPDVVAIILLSDIIYWYTPVMTRDEHTGDVIGIQQKFQADKLQKTYQEYAEIFGFSKKSIKNAIDNLRAQKLITREFRHIKTGTGLPINNVMYIEPIFENIVKISNKIRSPQKREGYPTQKRGDTPPKSGGIPLPKREGHPPKKLGGTPPKNGGTYTETTTEISTKNTTTTTASTEAVVPFGKIFPKAIFSLIPKPYRDHRDVRASLEEYLKSHGDAYIKTELDYATVHSTKPGGFPAFLKRSLANGWGAESLKSQKAIEDEKREQERLRREKDRKARKAEQERIAAIEAHDRQIEEKIQETMESLSPSVLGKIKAEALAEAESKTPKLRGQQSQMQAAAKEKLADLSQKERDELYEIANAVVKASIGGLIGQKHPGYQRVVNNQVLREIQERYPLKTPLVSLWQEKVKTEAKRILNSIIAKRYGITKFDKTAEIT